MERVKYIISFTINTGIPLCCSATLEHALTFCSSSEPADDTIFLTFYLVFTVCFFDNLIVDIILESVFLCPYWSYISGKCILHKYAHNLTNARIFSTAFNFFTIFS